MYRVFLADDNQLARHSLKVSILWEKNGFEIVGEAENGKEALKKIKSLMPDIALLDIKMPGLSGIEVAKQLLVDRSIPICIIISAYDDFMYMQQSLKLGIFDYLLKPVNNKELLEVLSRAKWRLEDEERVNNEQEMLRQRANDYQIELQKSSRDVKRKLFGDGVNGYIQSAKELQQILHEEWRFHCYEILLICPEKGVDTLYSDRQPDDLISYERKILVECETRFHTKLLDIWRKEGIVVLIIYQTVMTVRDYDEIALKIANTIFEKNKADGQHICAGISGMSQNLEELPNLFQQSVFSLNSHFSLENKYIIHYGAIKSKDIHNEYPLMKKLEVLYATLRDRPDDIMNCLDDFFVLLCEHEIYDVAYVKNMLVQTGIMMTCVIDGKYPAGVLHHSIIRQDTSDYIQLKSVDDIIREMTKASNIQEAFVWLKSYAEVLINICREEDGCGTNVRSKKALDYLNIHYPEHITLQDVANHVKLSSSHIGRILKNNTGETFVSLLNKIRIQAAIRLLREGDLKVYEIAERVGFSNYAYFYQLFKKCTGHPPTDYH
jgi:YesN/AraC family two-component response regulator